MADTTSRLPLFGVEPVVYKTKVLTAVVYLLVFESLGLSAAEDRRILRSAVAHTCHGFRQMDGCVRVMPYS